MTPKKPTPKKTVQKDGPRAAIPGEKQVIGGVLIGVVADYFAQVHVVSVPLVAPLSVGDMIRIKGHTTDITQPVDSIQLDHQPVQTAKPGDVVGLRIADKARKGDAIYKI